MAAGTDGGKEKKKVRGSAYLVNNQSQCAAAKTAGDWVCFSRLQPRQVDVDEGGKNGRQVVGR